MKTKPRYSDELLLTYGRAEIATFRAEMRELWQRLGVEIGEGTARRREIGKALQAVILAGRERRIAAGLTADEALHALRLAAAEPEAKRDVD